MRACCNLLFRLLLFFSVLLTVFRGPSQNYIQSAHDTPSFMHPLRFQRRSTLAVAYHYPTPVGSGEPEHPLLLYTNYGCS